MRNGGIDGIEPTWANLLIKLGLHVAQMFMKRMSSEKVYNSNMCQDPMRFTQLDPGEFEAGAVKWDIVGGDTVRSKIKQVQSSQGGLDFNLKYRNV